MEASREINASRVVERLLRAGAEVNHRDVYGRTALILAAQTGSVRSVALILLQRKDEVDLDARDDLLRTAEDVAQGEFIPVMLQKARDYQRSGIALGFELN